MAGVDSTTLARQALRGREPRFVTTARQEKGKAELRVLTADTDRLYILSIKPPYKAEAVIHPLDICAIVHNPDAVRKKETDEGNRSYKPHPLSLSPPLSLSLCVDDKRITKRK
jgi:hypothetical protein